MPSRSETAMTMFSRDMVPVPAVYSPSGSCSSASSTVVFPQQAQQLNNLSGLQVFNHILGNLVCLL
ncbi:MAG: hypothetical protein CM15mP74_11370 [Halieaceae bacterium]|nr:MAG: hypothetical protein CM15mP74_11370 [Halieaceae bacterium]